MTCARWLTLSVLLMGSLGFASCGDETTTFYRNQILYSDVLTILPGRIRALDWELDKDDELHVDVISSAALSTVALIQGDAPWAQYLQNKTVSPYRSLAETETLGVSWITPLDKRDFYYLLLENGGQDAVTVTVRVRY